MMNFPQASRAIVLATGLALALTTAAAAEEEAATREFSPTIYVGPAFGLAEQSGSEFGWSMQILARFYENIGVQIEYFNLGSIPNSSGELDGVYLGLAPILPVMDRLKLFAQVGAAFSDSGDDVAAGGGLLYNIPIEIFEKNNTLLTLRLDYKYLNLDDGDHLLTLGFMFGFFK